MPDYLPYGAYAGEEVEKRLKYMNDLSNLPPKPKEIIESFSAQYRRKKYLTSAQKDLLDRLYTEHSPEEIEKREEWKNNFTQEMRENFSICVEYYRSTSFFSRAQQRLDKNPEYTPSEKEYNDITQNKYTKKLLRNKKEKPQFEIGNLCLVRSTGLNWSSVSPVSRNTGMIEANTTVMIIENDLFRRGDNNRICRVMVFNNPQKIYLIRESCLKQIKKAKKDA